jgi:hypothetical protein
VSMTEVGLPDEALQLAARRASVSRQLDLILDERGPVQLVRQLVADLDRISADLTQALRGADMTAAQRQDR